MDFMGCAQLILLLPRTEALCSRCLCSCCADDVQRTRVNAIEAYMVANAAGRRDLLRTVLIIMLHSV